MGFPINLCWRYFCLLCPLATVKINYYSIIALSFMCFTSLYFVVLPLFSPAFVLFDEVSKVLITRSDLDHSTNNVCNHELETHLSSQSLELILNPSEGDVDKLYHHIKKGGVWSPPHCSSKYQVNLIIPYRNRQFQLKTYLHYFHRYLPQQEIDYRIVVIEQSQEKPFNRGKLFNIGFTEAEKRFPSDCYIFHDVDLIPTSLNNIYACSIQPRHMSSAIDIFNYQLPYANIFGGAVALSRHQFQRINGYSNSFFGWGGEDDDFFARVIEKSSILRFESKIARYTMMNHSKEVPNPDRFNILSKGRYRQNTDGLTNLEYSLLEFELKPLYTWILVNV